MRDFVEKAADKFLNLESKTASKLLIAGCVVICLFCGFIGWGLEQIGRSIGWGLLLLIIISPFVLLAIIKARLVLQSLRIGYIAFKMNRDKHRTAEDATKNIEIIKSILLTTNDLTPGLIKGWLFGMLAENLKVLTEQNATELRGEIIPLLEQAVEFNPNDDFTWAARSVFQRRLALQYSLTGQEESYSKAFAILDMTINELRERMRNVEYWLKEATDNSRASAPLLGPQLNSIKEYLAEVLNVQAMCYFFYWEKTGADTLDKLIESCEYGLELVQNLSVDVKSSLQNNLANGYLSRLQGNRAENLEKALTISQTCVAQTDRAKHPWSWALGMMSTGIIYIVRVKGNRSENIENAIQYLSQVFDIIKPERAIILWARAMNNITVAYAERLVGDQAINIERALRYSKDVENRLSKEQAPLEWALIKHNQGKAYLDRVLGTKRANLESGVNSCLEALQVLTPVFSPHLWAQCCHNLATIYIKQEELQKSIDLFSEILNSEFVQKGSPDFRAQIMNNLAMVFREKAQKETANQSENIEMALSLIMKSLEIRNETDFPFAWAESMHNLGMLYRERLEGDRNHNINKAIECLNQSLRVHSLVPFSTRFRLGQIGLGNIYFELEDWQNAYLAYYSALNAGVDRMNKSETEAGRLLEIESTSFTYPNAVYCLAKMNRLDEALLLSEDGKARILAETLTLSEKKLESLPSQLRNAILNKKQKIDFLDATITSSTDLDIEQLDSIYRERKELESLISEALLLDANISSKVSNLTNILSTIPAETALILPFVTPKGSVIFILSHGIEIISDSDLIYLPELTDEALAQILSKDSSDQSGWMLSYISQNHEMWITTTHEMLSELWEKFTGKISDKLKTLKVHKVVFILSGGLQVLPIHAASPYSDSITSCFLDSFEVSYVPSIYSLQQIQQKTSTQYDLTALILGISEYKKLTPLNYAVEEAQEIGRIFDAQCLVNDQATVDALKNKVKTSSYLHFACHSLFSWGFDPLNNSGLILANDMMLSINEVSNKLDLNSVRLVVLSSCETGLINLHSPDEYIGIQTSFLQAGVKGVICCLWRVNDLSALLFMSKFYELHIKLRKTPANALRTSQLWLRDLRNRELAKIYNEYKSRMALDDSNTSLTQKAISDQFTDAVLHPDEKPFAHPYYWAGFVLYGA